MTTALVKICYYAIAANGKLPYKNTIRKRLEMEMRKPVPVNGFTLMELMIVVAIIGILVLLAIPKYQNYTRRAHYAEVVQAASPYKLGVEECFQITGALDNCNAGINGVPPAIASGEGNHLVDTIEVSAGQIIITPLEKFGITTTDTYVLSPTVHNDALAWASGGGGVTAGYAH